MTVFTRRSNSVGRVTGAVIAVILLIGVAALAVFASPVGAHEDSDEYEPGGRYGPPLTPTNLRIAEHDSRLRLKWWKSGWTDGFHIQYRAQGDTEWINAGYCANWWAWDLILLDNGTTYDVRLRTRNSGQYSEWVTGSGTPQADAIPQPTERREVLLSGTMNAQRIGHCRAAHMSPVIGCDDYYTGADDSCATHLNNTTFTVDDTEYTVKSLYQGQQFWGNDAVLFWVEPQMSREMFNDLTLQIGALQLPLGKSRELMQIDVNGPRKVPDGYGNGTYWVFYPDLHEVGMSSSTAISLWRPAQDDSNSGQQVFGGSADADVGVPGAVRNLSVRENGKQGIRVDWDAPEDSGAVGRYEVTLVRDGEELSKRRPGAKKTHVVIRKLDPGATYTIHVKAKNAQGFGAERTAQITLRAADQ